MGVDVGGSGLRLVVSRDGVTGATRTAPGVRVAGAGIDLAALTTDAVGLLASEGVDRPDAVCWSMRGLLHLSDPADVLAAVGRGLRAARTAVVSDAVASLVGALGEVTPGAVVAAGTGAVALGSDFAEVWTRVDGWGHVLGDRGSAAWVGLEGLRAALRHRDGVPGGSPGLLDDAETLLGPVDDWPRRVMTGEDAPEALASIAPLVSAAAQHGDAVAARVCTAAGEALADSLLAASAGLPEPRLVGTGGLLSASPVRSAFDAALAVSGVAVTDAAGGALDGALHLAGVLVRTGALPRHPLYVHVATVGARA